MGTPFNAVKALFTSIELTLMAANRCDEAYAKGTGGTHTPFGVDNPQMVAMNIAGVYAADSAAHMLAQLGNDTLDGETYTEALRRITADELDTDEVQVVKMCANLAWRSGQPFRDIASKPLSRIMRDINMPFALLPVDEEQKDLIQVKEGAKILLEQIAASAA